MMENRMIMLYKRNSNIEMLRFILMTCVCFWHLLVHGMNYKLMGSFNEFIPRNNHLILMCLFVPAVNCFMFISGYWGMKFSYTKLYSFIIQAIFIFILGTIAKYIIWNDFRLINLIHIFPIITKQWWFLTEYITILLLSPILNAGIEKLEKKQFLFLIISLIMMNSIGLYLVRASLGYNLISLLIIYLLGRFMKNYNINIKRHQSVIFWCISTIILFLLSKISSLISPKITWLLMSYNNPLIIIQAVSIFYFTLSYKPQTNPKIILLGKHCFSIYLITELFGKKLYEYWAYLYGYNILICILCILCIELFCLMVDFLQSKINLYIRTKLAVVWKNISIF